MKKNYFIFADPRSAVNFSDDNKTAFFSIDGQHFVVSTVGKTSDWNRLPCVPYRGFIAFYAKVEKVFEIISKILAGKMLNGRGEEVSSSSSNATAYKLRRWQLSRFC